MIFPLYLTSCIFPLISKLFSRPPIVAFLSLFDLNRMQHHQFSFEQPEVWISLFPVWRHVTQYQKDNPTWPRSCHGFYQHRFHVSCSATSCYTPERPERHKI